MNKIVLTGATGMLGVALIKECLHRNTKAVALVRPKSKHACRLPIHPLLEVLDCPLEQLGQAQLPAAQGADAFYHFGWGYTDAAGRENVAQQQQNVATTLEAAAFAKRHGITRFIGAGSQAEYGRWNQPIAETQPLRPETPYGIAKVAAGQLATYYCHQNNIQPIWARIFSVYGPFDGENTMLSSAIKSLLGAQQPLLTQGQQQWDYLFVGDAAQAFYKLGTVKQPGPVYNIGSGQARPLREFIEKTRNCINPNLPLEFGQLAYSPKQVMHLCADISLLQKDTGFVPQTRFEEGIAKTVEAMKQAQAYPS